jgi:hypothetical protein
MVEDFFLGVLELSESSHELMISEVYDRIRRAQTLGDI